jgi:hypothetical protein
MEATAAVFFAIAALGGVFLTTLHFRGRVLPKALALLHGAVAVGGLALLLIDIVQAAPGRATGQEKTALILFAVASLGGLVLFFGFHLSKKRLPSALIVIHAVIAMTAFGLLIVHLGQMKST